jgi:hypothetical protein
MQKQLSTGTSTYFLQMNVTLSRDLRKTLASTNTTFCSSEKLQAHLLSLALIYRFSICLLFRKSYSLNFEEWAGGDEGGMEVLTCY